MAASPDHEDIASLGGAVGQHLARLAPDDLGKKLQTCRRPADGQLDGLP